MKIRYWCRRWLQIPTPRVVRQRENTAWKIVRTEAPFAVLTVFLVTCSAFEFESRVVFSARGSFIHVVACLDGLITRSGTVGRRKHVQAFWAPHGRKNSPLSSAHLSFGTRRSFAVLGTRNCYPVATKQILKAEDFVSGHSTETPGSSEFCRVRCYAAILFMRERGARAFSILKRPTETCRPVGKTKAERTTFRRLPACRVDLFSCLDGILCRWISNFNVPSWHLSLNVCKFHLPSTTNLTGTSNLHVGTIDLCDLRGSADLSRILPFFLFNSGSLEEDSQLPWPYMCTHDESLGRTEDSNIYDFHKTKKTRLKPNFASGPWSLRLAPPHGPRRTLSTRICTSVITQLLFQETAKWAVVERVPSFYDQFHNFGNGKRRSILGDLSWVAWFGLKWAKLVWAKSKHL